MDKSLGPTILYLADSNIHTQFREKVQKSDAKLFNEYVSLGLPMFVEGAIAFLIENSPLVALTLGQLTETGPAAYLCQ